MKKILLISILLLIIVCYASADWIDPTGFGDPGSEWINETNIYDNDTGTHGDRMNLTGWSDYINLNHDVFWCDKIQIYCYRRDADIEVEVSHYGSDLEWHVVYTGAYLDREWDEISLGGTYQITAVRLRFNNVGANVNIYFYECDFNETTEVGWDHKWNTQTISKWNNQEFTKWNGLE